MVKDIYGGSGSSWVSGITDVNGVVYFTANDGIHGSELWRTDGTEAGTVMVEDLTPGSGDSWFEKLTNVNGTLFFTLRDEENRPQLWKLDTGSASPGGAEDTVTFGAGITPDDITVQTRVGEIDSGYGMQLLIGTGNGEGMLIEAPASDGFSPSDLAIKNFVFDDGTILTLNAKSFPWPTGLSGTRKARIMTISWAAACWTMGFGASTGDDAIVGSGSPLPCEPWLLMPFEVAA